MRKGFFFTLDVSIALLLVMTVSVIAFFYLGKLQSEDFTDAVQYSYAQDASNLLAAQGCLERLYCDPLPSPDCAFGILSATPGSVCMDITGYSVSSASFQGGVLPAQESAAFTLSKQGCLYSGGQVQSLAFPLACASNQSGASVYRVALRTWQRGARP